MSKYTFASSPPYRGVSRVLGVLLGLSILLNIVLLLSRGGTPDEPDDGSAEGATEAATDAAADADPDGDAGDATPDAGDAGDETDAGDATPAPPPENVGDFASLKRVDVPLKVNLSVTIDGAVSGGRAPWVTATAGRIMVWWLDMTTDLRAADRLQLLYEPLTGDEVRIAALRYKSQKKEKEFRAYYYVPSGAKYGSYWDETGKEVPPRFKEAPIEDYQQITAVLGDGRDHTGYDFRAPVGTPVFAPRSASVVRANWNFAYNGNCIELRYDDGSVARYLHLESVAEGISAGASVRAGQRIGTSGNTGRTNAPHLHYEVEQAGRIVDPAEYHGTSHRSLSGSDLEAFRVQAAKLDEALGT